MARLCSIADAVENNIIEFFKRTFQGSIVIDQGFERVVFRLPQLNLKLAHVFDTIESNKERLHIVEYSVSQATLDQIFNSFARGQDKDSGPGGAVASSPLRRPNQTLSNQSLDNYL
eukprot:c430_g1_i1.p1 GENE.c430_g1_i1~~c430_g1_i1.p1  ORF type:complete len:116 (-),score=29.91 c430_g1_i1:181-528(-)